MADTWKSLVETSVTQYPLSKYGALSVLNKAGPKGELIIAGYASPQVVDREKHVITKKALAADLPRFMAHPHYRNVNLLHSNVQVGEVIPAWVDPESGQRYETKVDEVGLFVVVKIRTDDHRPPIVDKVIDDIEQGRIASFSISADAPFESRRHECSGGTCFWVIDEIVLYEVTVCETPVNQDAKFTVISKSFDEEGEFAASAWCQDGRCPVTPGQANGLLKSWRSTAGQMLFEGVADGADESTGLESQKPSSAPASPANRLVPEPTIPKFAKFLKGLNGLVHPGVQRMIDREFGVFLKSEGPAVAGLAVVAGDTGRLLMLQRALVGNDEDPARGTWEFPGGHVEPGEGPLESAKREWAEEVGQQVPDGQTVGMWQSEDGSYCGYVWKIASEAEVSLGERDDVTNPDDPDGDQLEAIAWWEPDHIEDNPALRDELKPQISDVVGEAVTGVKEGAGVLKNGHGGIDEFDEGLEVETEHYDTVGGDPETIAEITRDHLVEDPRYYSKLRRVEGPEGRRALNPREEFAEGLEVESAEHYESVGGDMKAIANIVRDHLKEDPHYYSKTISEQGGEEEEEELDPAAPSKLKRAKITGGSPDAKEMAEEALPKPVYGVSPSAPLADPDGERQYLNLGDIWASRGSFDLVEGDEDKSPPAIRDKVKAPKLAEHDLTFIPMVLKETLAAVEAAIDSVKLDKSTEADARAASAAIRLGRAELTWLRSPNDFVVWTDSTAFKQDRPYVRLTRLLKGLRGSATSAGVGGVVNLTGLAQARVAKSVPLTLDQFAERAEDIVRRATLVEGIPPFALSGLAKAWDSSVHGDPAAAIDGVRKQLEASIQNGRGDLDATVLAALDALYEDANSVIDGMVLGQYVKMDDEPEHQIIKEAGADNTYTDVAKTDAMLDRVSKAQSEKSDTIMGPDDTDGLSNKGGPNNLPEGFQERHLEAKDPHPGAMIAWFPESGLARQLAAEGGEDADDLHVTIVYLTDDAAADLGDEGIERALGALRQCARGQGPMMGTLGGIGRFSPGGDGKSPVIALVDVPGLSEFRAKLVGALGDAGVPVDSKHGFTPHMTLRYDAPGMDSLEQRGIPTVETSPVAIDRLWLEAAGQKFEVPLDQVPGAGPGPLKKAADRPGIESVTLTKAASGEMVVRLS